MKVIVRIAIAICLVQSVAISLLLPGMADTAKTQSTETTSEINVFAPKYRERIRTYKGQINTALSKGWLTPEAGQKFKDRLHELNTMEATANTNGYPKPELDNLEKAFTQFNIDLTAAENNKNTQPSSAASHSP